jgi:predicted deacylase
MVSLHSGSWIYVEPTNGKVIYDSSGEGDETGRVSRETAKAFGAEMLLGNPGYIATSGEVARAHNVPCMTAEFGGSDSPDRLEVYLSAITEGIRNVMAYLGMLPDRQLVLRDFCFDCFSESPSSRDGFVSWRPGVTIDSDVKEGQELAAICDTFGNEVEVITSPYSGRVILLRTYNFVHAGRVGGWGRQGCHQSHPVNRTRRCAPRSPAGMSGPHCREPRRRCPRRTAGP